MCGQNDWVIWERDGGEGKQSQALGWRGLGKGAGWEDPEGAPETSPEFPWDPVDEEWSWESLMQTLQNKVTRKNLLTKRKAGNTGQDWHVTDRAHIRIPALCQWPNSMTLEYDSPILWAVYPWMALLCCPLLLPSSLLRNILFISSLFSFYLCLHVHVCASTCV